MNALIVKDPWIGLILQGKKPWEIRGSNTKIRGTIGLIQSQSGLVLGTVKLVDSIALSPEEYRASQDKHCIPDTDKSPLPYKRIYAWVMEHPYTFPEPIPYQHPQGAVIWVHM